MNSSLRLGFSRAARRRTFALAALLLSAHAALSACGARGGGGGDGDGETPGVIIVSAPAAGEVRRVLASEGARLRKGEALVEIVVRAEGRAAPTPRGEDPVAAAGRNITAAQAEVEAARAEVVRAEVDVARLTPLVAAGQASQGELDGARALYERAQQRLARAQGAQAGLVAARQPNRNPAPTAAPSEQVVYATASSDGTVSAVSVRAGARVTQGQPLATLRAGR
ncbi:MAG TPA: biotin/lipoyl-binding protein [Pyrinomonadaceae bacterium]|jgi:multidrug resistance efflux pump